jgi:NitT/TauT family transport system permease protein
MKKARCERLIQITTQSIFSQVQRRCGETIPIMSETTRLTVWRLSIIFGVLAIVETSVRVGWISTFFLAAPTRAAVVLWEQIVHGNALWLTAITLFEIAACLTISTIFGVLAGFLLWRYRLIGNSYEMLLAALFSSPVILAYPIFLVTFGRGSAAVIALSSIFGLIPTIINTKSAFQNANPILLQVGASMNLTRQQMFRHILIPAVAPTIFSGFRLALTYILKSVLGLEYVAQVGGVGMWLSDAAFKFEVEEVYAGLFGTMLLSILFLYLINRSEVLVRK